MIFAPSSVASTAILLTSMVFKIKKIAKILKKIKVSQRKQSGLGEKILEKITDLAQKGYGPFLRKDIELCSI
jgi:hypothetical protein